MRRIILALLLLLAIPASAQLDDSMSVWSSNGILMGSSADVHGGGGGVGNPLTFEVAGNIAGSGPSNLSSTLTINGVPQTALQYFDARNISGATWTATLGTNATQTIQGANTTSSEAAPFTETGARAWASAATTYGEADYWTMATGSIDVGVGEDFVIEMICRNTIGNGVALSNQSSGGVDGIELLCSLSGGGTRLTIEESGGSDGMTITYTGAGSDPEVWRHILVGCSRASNLCRGCINGTCASSGSTAAVGALVQGAIPTIGYRQATGGWLQGQVVQVGFWRATGWFAATDLDATAQRRFAQVTGVYPARALGAITPTTATRGSVATLDIDRDHDGVRRLFLVGNNWMRTVGRKELAGGEYIHGYLPSPQVTNLVIQSQAQDVTWTATSLGVTANAATAPDGTLTADDVDAADAAGSVDHRMSQSITLTAASHTVSVWAKAGSMPSLLIRNGTANQGVCFNISTCAVIGVYEGTPTGVAESYGNGWCRVQMIHTATAAASSINLYISDDPDTCGATDQQYDDGTNSVADMTLWGAQVEAINANTGIRGASSYIATTTASVTRLADVLSWSSTSNVPTTGYTMAVQFMCPPPGVVGTLGGLFGVTQNSGASNFAELVIKAAEDPKWRVYATGYQAEIEPAGNVADGEIHELRGVAFTNDFQAWVDGTSMGTDVSGTLPVSIASLYMGDVFAGGFQSGCVIGRARIWSTRLPP